MKKNIQKQIEKSVAKSQRKQILSDIDALQCSSSFDVFDRACESFLAKWKDQQEFIKYFEEQWLIMNRNWYLGVLPGTPVTNNALEAFNRTIKDDHTLRERHSVSRFPVVAKDMVTEWSNIYKNNKSVSQQPTITLKQLTRRNTTIPAGGDMAC